MSNRVSVPSGGETAGARPHGRGASHAAGGRCSGLAGLDVGSRVRVLMCVIIWEGVGLGHVGGAECVGAAGRREGVDGAVNIVVM